MRLVRRNFLALSSLALLPRVGHADTVLQGGAGDAALNRLLQRHAELFLHRSPEEATNFSYDTGPNAGLRSRLDDRSLDAIARDRTAIAAARQQLQGIPVDTLSARGRIDHDVASFVYERLAAGLARPGYMDINLRPSPYLVNQMNGAYYWLPDFLGDNHPLENKGDLDAWYARFQALATALDQETARIRHDASVGFIPPNFVILKTVLQLDQLRNGPPAQSAMIAHAAARAQRAGLGDIVPTAARIFHSHVAPALERQRNALAALLPDAGTKAGVWALPDGDAYYAEAVWSNTTVKIAPDDLHRQGLEQVADFTAQLDRSLRAQGLQTGTVGERLRALNVDPRFVVSNDDAGRDRLLAEARRELADIIERLPRAFSDTPLDPITVRRVPVEVENGAPFAYYNPGVGGRAGTYMLNLRQPADLALWRLPTDTYHESVPGHHYQASVLHHAGSLPLFRRIVRFSAYEEGYALYAERLANEMGAYDTNPFGRIGYLQSELFRAARIVVDTGIHFKRWTREQAVAWMMENAGETRTGTEREVIRYCVYPGQACSFRVGANSLLAAREAARARLGDAFDIRHFHDLVLKSGPMPMSVMQTLVGQWQK